MNFGTNYGDDPNHVASMLKPVVFKTTATKTRVHITVSEHEKWVGEVSSYTSEFGPEDFEQATGLWEIISLDPSHKDRFVSKVAAMVSGVYYKELREQVYGMFPLTLLTIKGLRTGGTDF